MDTVGEFSDALFLHVCTGLYIYNVCSRCWCNIKCSLQIVELTNGSAQFVASTGPVLNEEASTASAADDVVTAG